MTNEPSSNPGAKAVRERSAMVAVAYVGMHSTIGLACFVVAAAITSASRAEFIELALPLNPLSLLYMRFANAVGAYSPPVPVGLGLALATIDLAIVYALGGRARIAQITRMFWSTAVTAIPFIILGCALFALDLPFRGITLSRSNVLEQYRQVEGHVISKLVGTWVVVELKRTGEVTRVPPRSMTITFSTIKGTYPDVHAESSDQTIFLSGEASVSYRGNGVCMHLDGGKQANGAVSGTKQMCLLPKEPGDRMVLWIAPPDSRADDHQPTGDVTVLTLERRKTQ